MRDVSRTENPPRCTAGEGTKHARTIVAVVGIVYTTARLKTEGMKISAEVYSSRRASNAVLGCSADAPSAVASLTNIDLIPGTTRQSGRW